MTSKPKDLKAEIYSLEHVMFYLGKIDIPSYQRPYKWTRKNVNLLIDDILHFRHKIAYRLGTIVVHQEEEGAHIVDGQQRLLTLSIIAAELLQTKHGRDLIARQPEDLSLASQELRHPQSIENLRRNHALIKTRIAEFGRDEILFFFKQCEFVYIELYDIAEAFQFFDSQNSRGKDLEPHDLLKAFHLREMEGVPEAEKLKCVEQWEAVSESLSKTFAQYLFRVRQWSKGRVGIGFSKKHVDVFKGVSFNLKSQSFDFSKGYRINHFFVSNYNSDPVRQIDDAKMSYPFQIDQVIINGQRFFEYIAHYADLIHKLEAIHEQIKGGNPLTKKIISTIDNYNARIRTGDQYIRNLFDCALLYYEDKFGNWKLDEALIRAFFWAYALRLENFAVKEVTIDNAGRSDDGLFKLIREAVHPVELIHQPLRIAAYKGDQKSVSQIEPIVVLFRKQNAISE